ncbi:hypothetical protein EON81_14505 [bacterium]|nr:MAG: hypothetical protein EON81_14505 [bacterium]
MMPQPRFLLLALALVALGGCRFKSWESFTSAQDHDPKYSVESTWVGNEYQSAGLANETSGRNTTVNYTKGAKNDQTSGFISIDQPAKGSGQHPGNLPNVARAGHGLSNGPAMQNTASSVGQPGIDSGRGY